MGEKVMKTFEVSLVQVSGGWKAVMVHSEYYPSMRPHMTVAQTQKEVLHRIMTHIVKNSPTAYEQIYLKLTDIK